MKLSWLSYNFSFPLKTEPEWAQKVERWYQLDAPAMGLAEVYWRHRARLVDSPAWILLASPGASNSTDFQFATTAPSPAKFVHTLPNIRSAALLQLMNWSGPVLCIQKDPNTILAAMREGLSLAREIQAPVWIASVTGAANGSLVAHLFIIDKEGPLKIREIESQNMANEDSHDRQWLSWLTGNRSQAFDGSGLWIE